MDLRALPIAITGASSGIGRATALACARAGMPVAVSARRADRLDQLVEEIKAFGGRALAVPGDVSNQGDCRRLIDATAETFGSIYAVFANAGYGLERPIHQCSEQDLRDIFETNFWGTLHTIRPALDRMLAVPPATVPPIPVPPTSSALGRSRCSPKPRGHILICSSSLSKLGMPYHGHYSATKAAQDHIARAMRIELRGTGIHISSVHPIGTRTELFEKSEERSGGRHAPRTPNFLMQPSETVANAVVRCLRRGDRNPPGEVWTSLPMRLAFALGVAMPGLTDRILRRMADKVTSAERPAR
ncbi:MAG: SDR family oxidoreductase [Phycisphaerales bacterium]